MIPMVRNVAFFCEGARLRGRRHAHHDSPKPLPIVLMAYSFSAAIQGMVADWYAETL